MNSLCSNSNQAHSINTAQHCVQQTVEAVSTECRQNSVLRSITKVFSVIRNYIVRKYNQRIDRQAFNYLLTLDESLLKDIGVTRGDVMWASQLPESEDAAKRIEEIARNKTA